MQLIEKAKGAVIIEPDFDRIINEIERVELTIRTMICFNYKYYYGENGYEDYKKALVDLADKLGFVKLGEGYNLKDKIDNLKLNYWM
jgi:cell division protein FtsB